jgi:hypothetical protein
MVKYWISHFHRFFFIYKLYQQIFIYHFSHQNQVDSLNLYFILKFKEGLNITF